MKIEQISPHMFHCSINPNNAYLIDNITWVKQLTPEETTRLMDKIILVEEIACKFAANMLKGVLKYDTDNRSLEEWLAFGIDDAVDTVSYLYLARERMKQLLGE